MLHIPPKKLVHNVNSMSSILINHFSTIELEQWIRILISLREKSDQKAKVIDQLQRNLENSDISTMKSGLNDANKRIWFKKWLLNVINLSSEGRNRKNPFPFIINLDLPELVIEKQLNIASLLFLFKSNSTNTSFYQHLQEKVLGSSSLPASSTSSSVTAPSSSIPSSSSSSAATISSISLKNDIEQLKDTMKPAEKELYKECINQSFQFNFLPLDKLTKLENGLHDLILATSNSNHSNNDQSEPVKEFLTKLTRYFPNHLGHPVIQQFLDFLYFNSLSEPTVSINRSDPAVSSSKIFIDRYFPKAINDSKVRRNELFENLSFELTHLINEYYLFYQKMEAETASAIAAAVTTTADVEEETDELTDTTKIERRRKPFEQIEESELGRTVPSRDEDITHVPLVSTANLRFLKNSHSAESTVNYVFEVDFQCFKRHSSSSSLGSAFSSSSSSASSAVSAVSTASKGDETDSSSSSSSSSPSSIEDVMGTVSSRYAAIEKSMRSDEFSTSMTYSRDREYTHDLLYRLADSSSYNKIFIDNLPIDVDKKMIKHSLRHYLTPTEQNDLKVWIFRSEGIIEKDNYRQMVDEVNNEILAQTSTGTDETSVASGSSSSGIKKDIGLSDLLSALDLQRGKGKEGFL
jgi:hypothetical protein